MLDRLVAGKSEHEALDCVLLRETVTIKARLFIGLIRTAGGEPASFIVQIEDRTDQLRAAAEIDSLRNRLAHVQRLGVMGEMAAGIAHEINQPLGAIATFSDGARRMLGADPPGLDDVGYALEQGDSNTK